MQLGKLDGSQKYQGVSSKTVPDAHQFHQQLPTASKTNLYRFE
jgi:hypothetical protein